MNRLPFQLPDFTRRQWTSTDAQQVWEPRLRRIGQAWSEIERSSVAVGIRTAALTNVSPDRMADAAAWAAKRGLVLLPLGQNARSQEYSATSRAPGPGEAWDYRAAYVRPDVAGRWSAAWKASDDSEMGAMLGFPSCCRAMFDRVWKGEGRIDTTWAMGADPDTDLLHVQDVHPMNQILGRWAGYRAVPHLPCSWNCVPTQDLGAQLLELGDELGYIEEMAWLREALSWPYEWSALHGIAEIRSPILRIMARTDATPGTLTVRIHSEHYPAEGARGTRHPYRTWKEERQQLVQLQRRTDRARRNGFASDEAMEAAHHVVTRAAASLAGHVDRICDLGAGDGTLLARLGESLGVTALVGVEVDPDRAKAPAPGVDLRVSDITDTSSWTEEGALIVLMPGRLAEMRPACRARVLAALRQRARHLLLYAYGDWLEKHGGLPELVNATIPRATGGTPLEGDGVSAALYELAPSPIGAM